LVIRMNMCKSIEKAAKKMKMRDFALLKGAVFFFTLFLLTAWPGFNNLVMSVAWYWYLALGILFAIPLWKKLF